MKALAKLRGLANVPAKPATPASGLTVGTHVLTLDGELPVQFLSAGDRVVTRDSGMALVRGLRRRKITCDTVQITAGSLGHKRPEGDTLLPAGQKVLVRDWRAQALFGKKSALVPVSRLVDGEFVKLMGQQVLDVYEIIFDRDHVLYASGLELAAETPATISR
ncbi:Hint domain-containing protein [Pseudooceanicola aestuarii]|uniref:Hint domain-containing protein n=1 Tax=Pseudooceanicola aestuarii TaxID=2697319 RepID=UPI0013D75A2D|nr:Hint domain-containing protein [Pseudooceanicola aestuarii]